MKKFLWLSRVQIAASVFAFVLATQAVVAEESLRSPPESLARIKSEQALWVGSCRNATFGEDGFLKVYLVETRGTLTGYISISGNLVGSGDLTGTRTADTYSITSKDPINDMPISWRGRRTGSRIIGEYFIAADARRGLAKQVGEWQVDLSVVTKSGEPDSERDFKNLFMLRLEVELNQPVKGKDNTFQTGAQSLFDLIHPAGEGVSVKVTDVDIEWSDATSHRSASDIRKYSVNYTLYWNGPIQKHGSTQMRLQYNTAIESVTAHEIIASSGVTKTDAKDIGLALGVLLGKAAIEALLNHE